MNDESGNNDKMDYPLHWGGHGFEVKQKEVAFNAEELLRRTKKLADEKNMETKPNTIDEVKDLRIKNINLECHVRMLQEEINQLKNKPNYEDKDPKYTIVYDEMSCTDWGFEINGEWRGANSKVTPIEYDDELLDYVLARLKEEIKLGHSDFKSVMECFQSEGIDDDDDYHRESCDTCGHWGYKTTWKI